jgi:hypothetical protein
MSMRALPIRTQDPLRDTYLSALDGRLEETRQAPSLAAICELADGAFPSLVAARLRMAGRVWREVSEGGDEQPGPELHAAEFEWYFTRECASELADFLTPAYGGALLMGAPKVAAAMAARGRRADLFDRSPFLVERFGKIGNLESAELRDPLGRLRSNPVVFFDAPWHEDHILRWLWHASLAVKRGGTIAFALFGELTRARAEAERECLLAAAEAIGETHLLEGVLAYETPRFEAEALDAAGIELRGPWRRGDLVIIEKATGTIAKPPAPRERAWETVRVSERVVKVAPGRKVGSPRWEHLSRLGTVSRSEIRGLEIELWTSRNEVAGASFAKVRQGNPYAATGS